jgi:two-component system, sensor histidine kinase and response regulator
MENGPNSFGYFFLISNLYILFVYYFHFYKNRHWFLRTYIIGKSLQLAGMILLEFWRNSPPDYHWDIAGIFFIICFPIEIFGIISYDGYFNKRIFRVFLYVTILLCITNLVVLIGRIRLELIQLSSLFFYTFGGVVLLRKNDKSRFRYLIGITYLAYSFITIFLILVIAMHISSQLPQDFSPDTIYPIYKIRQLHDNMIYFVMIISSIGYLVILKEQDEWDLEIANKRINEENLGLKKLDEEKNKFFSLMAHDLKGPIGSLANLTELLLESKDKLQLKDYEKWMNLINQSATRTYTLLNNLLQWPGQNQEC